MKIIAVNYYPVNVKGPNISWYVRYLISIHVIFYPSTNKFLIIIILF